MLDGGAFKMSFAPSPGASKMTLITTQIGAVESNKNYRLKFSLLGSNYNNPSLTIYLRRTAYPYDRISDLRYVKISGTRTENEVVLSVPVGIDDASVTFEDMDQSTNFWLDNIQLHEADVTFTNPDDHFRFEYNASNQNKTVSLDANYLDVKGNRYLDTLVLAPYSSVVLIKKPFNRLRKVNQTISFASIPDKTFGDAPFSVTATASSGLAVSLRIVSGPATISGNTITLTGAGTVMVVASQNGNNSYSPATPVSRVFSVVLPANRRNSKSNRIVRKNSILLL
jgi:hypothetical protein